MTVYYIDMETRSPVSLPDKGLKNYVHPYANPSRIHADIVCMAYKINQGYVQIWTPADGAWPITPIAGDTVYAHNAIFDWYIWNTVGVRRYSAPLMHIDMMIDTMALCGRVTIPQSLAKAGEVLNVGIGKDKSGRALIKAICIPPYKYTAEQMQQFLRYCMRDVEALYSLVESLPMSSLGKLEQSIWKLTATMNLRGVPVDVTNIHTIFQVIQVYIEKANRELPVLTRGAIVKHTQAAAIVKWAASQGVDMPNCTAGTVVEYLEKDNLPLDVRRVLELRQMLALTSTAKYKKLMELEFNGRIYENLRYHAASTGRWGGMGAQLHNLPRASVEDPESEIKKFQDRSILRENPLASAKALVRPMIKAPNGYKLVVADYASIENRGLMWLCNEFMALDLIRAGRDQYIDMASDLYMTPYDDITKKQRALGKTLILGAGYNLGGPGFKNYADGYGIEISENEALIAITKYREKYPNVVKYWYQSKDTMINAIKDKGGLYEFGKCTYMCTEDRTGRLWLILTLPSGRSLFYMEPEIILDTYGELPTHMGLNSYTRKWSRLKIIPGRIIENIVQAICRDMLADVKLRMDKAGLLLVLSVHDEPVVEAKEDIADSVLQDMIGMMRVSPSWCPDLPLDADGFVTQRYRKG